MRAGLVLGEVWNGLRRNMSVVISVVLVTFVSLTFVGAAILMQLQIQQMKTFWYDRAQVAESWFSMLKNEMYYRHRFATRQQARFHVMQYIEVFYNRQRLHSSLGYRTPAEARADYTLQAAIAA